MGDVGVVEDEGLLGEMVKLGGVKDGRVGKSGRGNGRGRRQGPRPKLKIEAKRCLEDWFKRHIGNPYPTEIEKEELAVKAKLGLDQGLFDLVFCGSF